MMQPGAAPRGNEVPLVPPDGICGAWFGPRPLDVRATLHDVAAQLPVNDGRDRRRALQ